MNHPDLAPIALFAYNRPDHLSRVLNALALNPEASNSKLVVFSDAPKNPAVADQVQQVRMIAREVGGFSSVEVVEQRINQGVAKSVIQGVGRLVEQFGKVIVLEDDLLPSRHFLRYMNGALDLYGETEKVISIHGYSYPVSSPLPETFFLRGADCWGWATWKRGWDLFEADAGELLAELKSRKLSREFDFDGCYPYTRMLRDSLKGKNDSWAIRWYASAFLRGKVTLYPGSSQVQNIGADGSGYHLHATDFFEHSSWGKPVDVIPVVPTESLPARRAFASYLAGLRPAVGVRILRRIKNIMSTQAE